MDSLFLARRAARGMPVALYWSFTIAIDGGCSMPKKIAVIDGNSLMHRAYHAVPPDHERAGRHGPPTPCSASSPCCSSSSTIARPDAVICAFDAGQPGVPHRRRLEQYKAQRPPMDDDLKRAVPHHRGAAGGHGRARRASVKGWEGDDILGTVARARRAAGLRDAAGDRATRTPTSWPSRQDAHRHHQERHHRRGHLRPGRGARSATASRRRRCPTS